MLWSWRFRLLSSVAAWTIPVRGWSWTSSSPTMRHAWSTWRVCAGRKGLCAWAVAGWERSGEQPTLSKADLGAGGNRVPPHALAPASVVSRSGSSRGNTEPMLSGSSMTAWVWLHKLRRGPTGSRPLSGVVQVDDSRRGRGGWSAGPRDDQEGHCRRGRRTQAGEYLSAPVLRGSSAARSDSNAIRDSPNWGPYGHEPLDLRRSRACSCRPYIGWRSSSAGSSEPSKEGSANTSPTIWTSSPFLQPTRQGCRASR